MPKEPSAKEMRKGTRSCVECRKRKTRCIWKSDSAARCWNCEARDRECVPQTRAVVEHNLESQGVRMSSRDRIHHLEANVTALWTALQNVEANAGMSASSAPTNSTPGTGAATHDPDTDSEEDEVSPATGPSHLRQLFDNSVLDTGDASRSVSIAESQDRQSSQISKARQTLQAAMPHRSDVEIIARYANNWLGMYSFLFSSVGMAKTSEEMLSQYDSSRDVHAQPVVLGRLLLILAMTVRHMPANLKCQLQDVKDIPGFVQEATKLVENTIIANDTFAGTLEGIEIGMLFLRLQMTRTKGSKNWIILRRLISLAELIGLPRAYKREKSSMKSLYGVFDNRVEAGLGVWREICILDRISGIMLNLPLGTASYPFPRTFEHVVDPVTGKVEARAYLCDLMVIAAQISDVDDMHASNCPDTEILALMLKIDGELHTLAAQTPSGWWSINPGRMSADQVVQYWHRYFQMRTHLRLALRNDARRADFAYYYSACMQAGREVISTYILLRRLPPVQFFLGQMLDLHVLTAAVLILYAGHVDAGSSEQAPSEHTTQSLIESLLPVIDEVASVPSNAFAKGSAHAIRSLNGFLNNPSVDDQRSLTLNVPLLGKVQVGRKQSAGASTSIPTREGPHGSVLLSVPEQPPMQQNLASEDPAPLDYMDFSWSMDFIDFSPALSDNMLDEERWSSFANRNPIEHL